MNAMLSRPQVEFLHSQVLALDAIFKVGEYDAQQSLQRTRSILQVVKCTLETAMKKEDMKGYDFSHFDC